MTLAATLPCPATVIDDAYVDTRIPYQPYAMNHASKEKNTLELIDLSGSTDTLYYPYAIRLRSTPPRLLSLIYFDAVFTLQGHLLDTLRPLLRDKQLAEIHVFNAGFHLPCTPDTPRIEKITLEPRRAQTWDAS